MASTLAAPELLASPLGGMISHIEHITLTGQPHLLVTTSNTEPLSPGMLAILARLGATRGVYEYFEQIGEVQGPLLRPLEPQFTPFVPWEMAEVRRYKGKTNEVFTQVLL